MAGGVEVDLHRLLVWGPIGVRVPTDELWRTSRSFVLDGRSLSTLGLEETLLHACCHLLVAGWRRALTLRDVAQLLVAPDLDPERATGLARRWGGESVLAVGVLLAAAELELTDEVPLLDWARGFRTTWRDRLWLRVERPDDPVPGLEAVGTFVELRTWRERAMLLQAAARPRPGTWPTPGQRLTSLARRASRAVSAPASVPRDG